MGSRIMYNSNTVVSQEGPRLESGDFIWIYVELGTLKTCPVPFGAMFDLANGNGNSSKLSVNKTDPRQIKAEVVPGSTTDPCSNGTGSGGRRTDWQRYKKLIRYSTWCAADLSEERRRSDIISIKIPSPMRMVLTLYSFTSSCNFT